MTTSSVPDAWKPRLRQFLSERGGEAREHLSSGDFPADQNIMLRFHDGSMAYFGHAFALADESAGEVAIFTEHCGYHIFPLVEAKLELLRSPA